MNHGCEVRRADPVDGRAVEGWLAVCSCGYSAGNFLEYTQAVDDGHRHVDIAQSSPVVQEAMARFNVRYDEVQIEKAIQERDPKKLAGAIDAAKKRGR